MTDLTVRTLEASTTSIPQDTVATLRGRLRGTVALPGEDGYDAARTIWNAMVDRRPALVVRCLGTADVINAVKVCEGGLLIDLSLMKSVRVDPASRTARVEPGATLADFDKEAQAFGLNAAWDQFDDRCRRPHAWRRFRLDHPQVRADRR